MGVMPGTRRCPNLAGALRRLASDEDGFGLVEVMVSAVLLITLAIATLNLLDTSQAASSMNRSRGVAATLAQADQESMRQLPLNSITGGYHPDPVIKNVAGIDYTILSEGDWTRDATGVVTCSTAPSTAGRGEYLTITSTVSWPGMATTHSKPVVMQSIVAPGVAALGATKGALAIKLKGADGSGTPGIGVSAGAVGGTTDSDGCVVLNNLDAGATTVKWDEAGYVDPDGKQQVVKDETIGAGTTAQDNGAYDRAAQAPITFTDDAGTPVSAKWWSVSLTQTGMQSSGGVRVFKPSGGGLTGAITADALFPFTSAYGVYAGSCAGNDPNSYNPVAGFGNSVLPAPGGSAPLSLKLRTVQVTVTNSSGVASSGAIVQAYPYTGDSHMAGCAEATKKGDWVTNAAGVVKIPLPYGVWQFCAQKASGSNWFRQSSTTTPLALDGPANNTEDDPNNLTDPYRRSVDRTLKFPSSPGSSTNVCT
jgi:Tfp pilus assembly protein PilV